MTCKEYYELKDYVNYTNLYEYDNIKNLPMNSRFKRLVYRGQIPDTSENKYHSIRYFCESIPDNITHLEFECNIDDDINDSFCLSLFLRKNHKKLSKLTHLKFGNNFNQNIKWCIPHGVTHLTFGLSFNQKIKYCTSG